MAKRCISASSGPTTRSTSPMRNWTLSPTRCRSTLTPAVASVDAGRVPEAPPVATLRRPEASIKAWLDDKAIDYPTRGRLPENLVEQWMAAHK